MPGPEEKLSLVRNPVNAVITKMMEFLACLLYIFGGTVKKSQLLTNSTTDTDTQLDGGNICSRVTIKALSGNSDIVWVEFESKAVEDECWDFEPGDVLDVPLNHTRDIHALFKAADDKLIILFKI